MLYCYFNFHINFLYIIATKKNDALKGRQPNTTNFPWVYQLRLSLIYLAIESQLTQTLSIFYRFSGSACQRFPVTSSSAADLTLGRRRVCSPRYVSISASVLWTFHEATGYD